MTHTREVLQENALQFVSHVVKHNFRQAPSESEIHQAAKKIARQLEAVYDQNKPQKEKAQARKMPKNRK